MSTKLQRVSSVRGLQKLAAARLKKPGDQFQVACTGNLLIQLSSARQRAAIATVIATKIDALTHFHMTGSRLTVQQVEGDVKLAGHGASAKSGSRK